MILAIDVDYHKDNTAKVTGVLFENREDKELYLSEERVTQKQREALIESKTQMLYFHPHMTENSFDLGRVNLCGNLVPDESGDMMLDFNIQIIPNRI